MTTIPVRTLRQEMGNVMSHLVGQDRSALNEAQRGV